MLCVVWVLVSVCCVGVCVLCGCLCVVWVSVCCVGVCVLCGCLCVVWVSVCCVGVCVCVCTRRLRYPYFRSCSMKTFLANDFAVVRLETKEGTFYYRNISGEEFFFFATVLNKFQKLAAGENYSHYSFILIPKQ